MVDRATDENIVQGRQERYPRRLHMLEERFAALVNEIEESPQKQALSVLHGMLHELWRQVGPASRPPGGRVTSPVDVAELYRSAPKMEGPAENTPLQPGTPAPDFALPDASGRLVRLSDYRGHITVLAFYPLDWSPGCSQQLDLYQQELDEFEKRGARLIGISVDSIYCHGAWAAVRGLRMPLLADFHPKGDVARRYHVYRESDGYSERALYVVDGEGIIRYAHVSPFLHHVPDIYELFAAIDAVAAKAAEQVGARP